MEFKSTLVTLETNPYPISKHTSLQLSFSALNSSDSELLISHFSTCLTVSKTCQNSARLRCTIVRWLFNLFPHATLPSSTWSALRCTLQWIALMTGKASLWCSRVTPSKPCICHGLAWWSEVGWVCQISKSFNFDWWTLQKTAHDCSLQSYFLLNLFPSFRWSTQLQGPAGGTGFLSHRIYVFDITSVNTLCNS